VKVIVELQGEEERKGHSLRITAETAGVDIIPSLD